MMLDMKRTFDEVVLANTTPEKAEQIFANPFYQSLSASFAGTQEYMAMEKLSQLRAQLIEHGDWDLIVVDTPPSRSALDFLDAPQRLGRFLDGRMIRLLTAPARAGGKAYLKVVAASFSVFTRVMNKILGNDLLANVSAFVASLETMFGGFRERAEQTYRLLKAPGTAFVVVASPEPDALREASFFVERLQAEEMPLAGVVLNRVRGTAIELSGQRALDAAERLAELSEQTAAVKLAVAALQVHAETAEAARHDRSMVARFGAAHPDVAERQVPALPTDVHDLAGLRRSGSARRRHRPGSGRTGCDSQRHPAGGPLASACGSEARLSSWSAAGEERPPGLDVGTAAQQGTPLTLGHAAPDAELGPAVEGIGQAVEAHRAAHADGLGLVLGRAHDEQRLRIDIAAGTAGRPLRIAGRPDPVRQLWCAHFWSPVCDRSCATFKNSQEHERTVGYRSTFCNSPI